MPDRAAALAAALAPHLPRGIAVAGCPAGTPADLMAGEMQGTVVPARLAEFAGGRKAARMALAAAGLPVTAIPAGADRAPVWPETATGSITHAGGLCLALAARDAAWAGLGIDLEPDSDLPRDLWDSLLLADEQLRLAADPQGGRHAKVIFSAKEAAYKAQYARSRSLFGFDMLRVTLSGQAFRASFQAEVAPFAAGAEIEGCFLHAHGHVLTAAWIAA
jgi:4'-phosphopantetheinyl transferase EntD